MDEVHELLYNIYVIVKFGGDALAGVRASDN